MNILHTIILKISHVIAAVIVIMGLSTTPPAANPTPPTSTVIDIPAPVQLTVPSNTPAPPAIQPSPTPLPPPDPTPTNLPPVPDPAAAPTPAAPDPSPINVPIYIIQPDQTSMPDPTPMPEPISQAKIEIVSPMGNKGLGRDYLARADIKDEANYITIGAILTNPDGSINNTAEMTVTTSDSAQDQIMDGTGSLWSNRYINGQKSPAYYYEFTYQFKTTGDHILTFGANGLTKSITINVPAEDTRP